MLVNNKNEANRIKEVYARRKEIIPTNLYSFFDTANLFIVQRREVEILRVLKKAGFTFLKDK